MNNFQLYKTCIPLSGQIKWNLTLESARNEDGYGVLFVNDFKLAPISTQLQSGLNTNRDVLNYSHLENLKRYYKSLENQFYKPYPTPELDSLLPVIQMILFNEVISWIGTNHHTKWAFLGQSIVRLVNNSNFLPCVVRVFRP